MVTSNMRSIVCKPRRGFTLIELLVVMAALGLMLAIVAPRYAEHVDRAREVALKQNLHAMRDTIDKFYSDRARYPLSIEELVVEGYLRAVPLDPVTDRTDTWVWIAPRNASQGAISDVRSGAVGSAMDGTAYASW
jgi:general secretion pathway protein G